MKTFFTLYPKYIVLALLLSSNACRNSSYSELEGLVVPAKDRWPNAMAIVCWKNDSFEEDKKKIETIVQKEFNEKTNFKFQGWKKCPENLRDTTNIVGITINPYSEPGVGIGYNRRLADNTLPGINFLHPTYRPCTLNDEMKAICLNNVTLHEFAHILGIVHEQERSDSPCHKFKGYDYPGQENVGKYNPDSVTNACNEAYYKKILSLSPGDIEAIEYMYKKN